MDDLIKKHLQDILTAIEEIESFFGDKPKLFDDFYRNLCLRRAIPDFVIASPILMNANS